MVISSHLPFRPDPLYSMWNPDPECNKIMYCYLLKLTY